LQKKVFIIEDEDVIARQMEEAFTAANLSVSLFSNGEKGLETALKEHPDAIILDILLPNTNGLKLLDKLRQDTWGATTPVILFTNLSPDDSVVKEVLDKKPSFYLLKANTSVEELLQKVKETLHIT